MNDPIQQNTSVGDWIRENKLESLRRLAVWLALIGVLVYIIGEVGSDDFSIQVGIWLLLAGIGLAALYSFISYFVAFFGK